MVDFARTDDGVRLMLDDLETSIIKGLVGELRELITDHDTANDPVIGRLFPSAYDNPAEEAVYQDLVGDDLSRYKLEALDVVSAALNPAGTEVMLQEESVDAWLACLTDMRLAIGTRLDVDEEQMAAGIDPAHPNARALAVLHWLGGIQEGILRTIDE